MQEGQHLGVVTSKVLIILPNSTKIQRYSGKMGSNPQGGDHVLRLELEAIGGLFLDFVWVGVLY